MSAAAPVVKPLLAALLLLTACKTEAQKRREVFECDLTGKLGECLVARYGWDQSDVNRVLAERMIDSIRTAPPK